MILFFSGNAGCSAMQVGQQAVLPELLITVISRLVKPSPPQHFIKIYPQSHAKARQSSL
jgi:hypothetical protein